MNKKLKELPKTARKIRPGKGSRGALPGDPNQSQVVQERLEETLFYPIVV
jgi:hypothetical protein